MCAIVAQSCPILRPIDCNLPGSSVHRIFPGKNTGVGSHSFSSDLPTQGLNLFLLQFSYFISVLSLSNVRLFATPWTTAHQVSLSITNSQNLLKLTSTELVMPSNPLIVCHPLLLPSIFPSIRGFSNESALHTRWPYWSFSFSISPSYEYSGLISSIPLGSPCSPRDSQESSPALQFKSINSSVLSLFYCPAPTSVHDYWKNQSFDYTDLCRQSNISAF